MQLVSVVFISRSGSRPAVSTRQGPSEAEAAAETAKAGNLPIGVAVGATLKHAVAKDAVLTYADVALPAGRLVDRYRAEQAALFAPAFAAA